MSAQREGLDNKTTQGAERLRRVLRAGRLRSGGNPGFQLDSLGTNRDNTQFQYDRVARQKGVHHRLGGTQVGNPMPPACR